MPHFSPGQQQAIASLARDLDKVFGARLRSLVAYHGHHGDEVVHSCAVVDDLSFRDLAACLPLTDVWSRHSVAVPLMLGEDEIERTIDIFPLEYASIMADHVVVRGVDPFGGVTIPTSDLRRACEAQAKSHLIHLREAFLESHGETRSVARLIANSAAPLRAILTNIARLPNHDPVVAIPSDAALADIAERRMGVSASVVREVFATAGANASTIADPSALLARYIDAAQRIWEYVDAWR
jgi:hypothetical protein